MATDVNGDVILTPVRGEPRTLEEWTTTFHLALVVLDPFTYESSWILETSGRILRIFAEADCRTAFLTTGNVDETKQFLGPWAQEFLAFADPDRAAVAAMGLDYLPAFVHLNQNHQLENKAEGWHPKEWKVVSDRLAQVMSWRPPVIPLLKDPAPFDGSPALD